MLELTYFPCVVEARCAGLLEEMATCLLMHGFSSFACSFPFMFLLLVSVLALSFLPYCGELCRPACNTSALKGAHYRFKHTCTSLAGCGCTYQRLPGMTSLLEGCLQMNATGYSPPRNQPHQQQRGDKREAALQYIHERIRPTNTLRCCDGNAWFNQ